MTLINPTRIMNNLIVLGVLGWIFFMIYTKMDKEKVKDTWEKLSNLFGGKKE